MYSTMVIDVFYFKVYLVVHCISVLWLIFC